MLSESPPDLFGGFVYGVTVECPLDSSSRLILSVLLSQWNEVVELCFDGVENLRMLDLNLAGGFSIREFLVTGHDENQAAHFASDLDGLSLDFKFREATFRLFQLEPSLTRHYVGWDENPGL
jgi:hypothetical protein